MLGGEVIICVVSTYSAQLFNSSLSVSNAILNLHYKSIKFFAIYSTILYQFHISFEYHIVHHFCLVALFSLPGMAIWRAEKNFMFH